MYCDVRQLLGYIREGHGGVFRRVALSGLIDSADRPHKQRQKLQTTRVIRCVIYTIIAPFLFDICHSYIVILPFSSAVKPKARLYVTVDWILISSPQIGAVVPQSGESMQQYSSSFHNRSNRVKLLFGCG